MNRFLVPILEGIKASFLVTTHNNIQVQVWLPSSGWVNRYWVLSIFWWKFILISILVLHGQLLKSYGSRYLLLIQTNTRYEVFHFIVYFYQCWIIELHLKKIKKTTIYMQIFLSFRIANHPVLRSSPDLDSCSIRGIGGASMLMFRWKRY